MPLSSSPWTAADSHSFGPGRSPWTTTTGSDSDVSVGRRATGSSTSVALAGRDRGAADDDRLVAGQAGAGHSGSGPGAGPPRAVGVALLDELDDRPATSTPVVASIPSSPGELLTSITTGPWFDRRMSTPAHVEPHRPGRPHRDCPLLGGEPDLARPCRRGAGWSGSRRARSGARMAATTRLPTTKARMSAPPASLMYSCTRMLASSWRKAAMTDSAALLVSASTTPMPWVPSSSLTTTGAPPTVSSRPSMSLVEWAKPVTGRPMPLRASSWRAAELVAGAADGLGLVGREDAHHLELAHDGRAVERV